MVEIFSLFIGQCVRVLISHWFHSFDVSVFLFNVTVEFHCFSAPIFLTVLVFVIFNTRRFHSRYSLEWKIIFLQTSSRAGSLQTYGWSHRLSLLLYRVCHIRYTYTLLPIGIRYIGILFYCWKGQCTLALPRGGFSMVLLWVLRCCRSVIGIGNQLMVGLIN